MDTNIPGPVNTPTKYPTRRYNTRHRKQQIAELERYSPSPPNPEGDARYNIVMCSAESSSRHNYQIYF